MTRYFALICFFSFSTEAWAFQVLPASSTSAYEKAIIASQTEATIIPDDHLKYSPLISCANSEMGNYIDLNSIPSSSSVGVQSSVLRAKHYFENVVDIKPITPSLFELGVTNKLIPPRRDFTPRTFTGLDNMPTEYWYDNRIHTFGNSGGLWGGVHALMAPLATRIIDDAAYKGVNAREKASIELQKHCYEQPNLSILDLCCGVGMSTRALSESFKDAQHVLGVDTSPEMISMARSICKYQRVLQILKTFHVRENFITDLIKMIVEIQITLTNKRQNQSNVVYARGNAERVNVPKGMFDLVTIMYGFHEIPRSARGRILREARRVLKKGGVLAVVDICEDFVPSATMLAGEPYVLEYQKNICHQMDSMQGFVNKEVKEIVPGHVKMWVMTRKTN